MDEPKGASRSGGAVAAPVFKEIAETILPELGVTPDAVFLDETEEKEEFSKSDKSRETKTVDQNIKPAPKKKEKNSKEKPGAKKKQKSSTRNIWMVVSKKMKKNRS